MFNLFKKKSTALDVQVKLMMRMCAAFPIRGVDLAGQISVGIIIGVKILNKPFANYNKFSLDSGLLNRYEDKKGRSFLVRGILVYDLSRDSFEEVILVVGYGILLGYSTPAAILINPDVARIDVRSAHIQYFETDDLDKLKEILSEEELQLINPADVYEMELKGKTFYHLHDLGDGDFLAVDREKNVFKITHDPYEIKKIEESLTHYLKEHLGR